MIAVCLLVVHGNECGKIARELSIRSVKEANPDQVVATCTARRVFAERGAATRQSQKEWIRR